MQDLSWQVRQERPRGAASGSRFPPVRALAPVSPGAPLWKSKPPVRRRATHRARLGDRLSGVYVPKLLLVDDKRLVGRTGLAGQYAGRHRGQYCTTHVQKSQALTTSVALYVQQRFPQASRRDVRIERRQQPRDNLLCSAVMPTVAPLPQPAVSEQFTPHKTSLSSTAPKRSCRKRRAPSPLCALPTHRPAASPYR